jgi:host factor-I protein
MAEKYNLQDPYTNLVRTKKEKAKIFLVNGFQVQGKLKSFDNFTFLVEDGKTQNLIFKHATSTIIPQTVLRLPPPKTNKTGQ